MRKFDIINSVTAQDIKNGFAKVGRDNFSIEAIEAYCELMESSGEPFKIDYIEIDSYWLEATPQALREDFCHVFNEGESYTDEEIADELSEYTTVLMLNNGNLLIDTWF